MTAFEDTQEKFQKEETKVEVTANKKT